MTNGTDPQYAAATGYIQYVPPPGAAAPLTPVTTGPLAPPTGAAGPAVPQDFADVISAGATQPPPGVAPEVWRLLTARAGDQAYKQANNDLYSNPQASKMTSAQQRQYVNQRAQAIFGQQVRQMYPQAQAQQSPPPPPQYDPAADFVRAAMGFPPQGMTQAIGQGLQNYADWWNRGGIQQYPPLSWAGPPQTPGPMDWAMAISGGGGGRGWTGNILDRFIKTGREAVPEMARLQGANQPIPTPSVAPVAPGYTAREMTPSYQPPGPAANYPGVPVDPMTGQRGQVPGQMPSQAFPAPPPEEPADAALRGIHRSLWQEIGPSGQAYRDAFYKWYDQMLLSKHRRPGVKELRNFVMGWMDRPTEQMELPLGQPAPAPSKTTDLVVQKHQALLDRNPDYRSSWLNYVVELAKTTGESPTAQDMIDFYNDWTGPPSE